MTSRPTPGEEAPVADRKANSRERAQRSDAKASRKTLLAAARELFAERGPEALTIVEVAKRAGLNRSTAYQHFRNRHELTQAVAELFADDLRQMMQEPRNLGEQINFFVHYFQEHPDIGRLWMFHLLMDQNRPKEGWGDYIGSVQRMAKSSRSLPGIDGEMLGLIGMSSALMWSVMAPQHSQGKGSTRADTDRFAAELKRLFLAGTLRPEFLTDASPYTNANSNPETSTETSTTTSTDSGNDSID
ncbi:MAG: TetR/AcrR family transcriptional regulator [Myxococcales bacterium]|nr:TetR/AcrR family transcriptional regulator [Myxococcales bacterium]